MTRKERVLEYIREHPGETLGSINAAFPGITSMSLILCCLTKEELVTREKVECVSDKRGFRYNAFAYYAKEVKE